jgi:hypothetical protein
MRLNKYKFSYTPQYSDHFYFGIFVLGLGTILLLKQPFLIPVLWVLVIYCIYFFIKNKPNIFFYEDNIEITKGFGKNKNTSVIAYSDVQKIEYCFSEMGRGNIFKIFLLQSGKVHSLQYTFMGNPTQSEIAFFDLKGMTIEVMPKSARYKLYPPLK